MQNQQCKLPALLGISIGAMLAGANDLRAIFRWGRRLKPEALKLLAVEDRAPCHATYHYVSNRSMPTLWQPRSGGSPGATITQAISPSTARRSKAAGAATTGRGQGAAWPRAG